MVEPNWQEEFLRLFSSGVQTEIDAALRLKSEHIPATLFKFFPPTERAFSALSQGKIWLASPETFNDPFDSSLVPTGTDLLSEFASTLDADAMAPLEALGMSRDDIAALISQNWDEARVERLLSVAPPEERLELYRFLETLPALVASNIGDLLRSASLSFQKFLKVSCFTEHAASLLLWAHYADAHKGFCVEYRFDDLPAHDVRRRHAFPVLYGSDRFNIAPTAPRFRSGNVDVPVQPILAALHKSSEWSYEKEWRIVGPDNQVRDGYPLSMPKPRGVYSGVRASDSTTQQLQAICRRMDIPIRGVSLSHARYEVLLE